MFMGPARKESIQYKYSCVDIVRASINLLKPTGYMMNQQV